MSPVPADHECAYGEDDCRKPETRCLPAEKCNFGRTVFRDKYTQGGHHHRPKGKETK